LTPTGPVSTIGRWWPALAWTALIFGASSIPGSRLEDVGFRIPDKLVHGLEYAVLGALLCGILRAGARRPEWRAFLIAVALGALVGALDENYQRLIPLRDSSFADWIADLVGCAAGAALAWRTGFSGLRRPRRDR
jgi:VanZ family protein